MRYRYDVRIADRTPRSAAPMQPAELAFAFSSHDDLNAIVERVRAKGLFDDDEAKALCVGLKLLGGVLLNHREAPLFKEFAAAFGHFMKSMKAAR
jgi:Domain of Unknown Function with PDB structure (DUF3861)